MDEDDLIKAISANKLIMEALTLNKIEPGIAFPNYVLPNPILKILSLSAPPPSLQNLEKR
jgi:hypothetical protein